jgi:hypothetical protein
VKWQSLRKREFASSFVCHLEKLASETNKMLKKPFVIMPQVEYKP